MNNDIKIEMPIQYFGLEIENPAETMFSRIRRECNNRFKKIPETTAKIAGYSILLLTVDIVQMIALVATHTNWSTRNPIILSASEICSRYIAEPSMDMEKFIIQYTPEITFQGQQLSKVFIAALVEECVCRGLIQRTMFPFISKIVSRKCGDFVNARVNRIAISALLFALAHPSNLYAPPGIWPQFTSGIILGAVAEKESSLFIPTMTHFITNLFWGAGE